MPATPQGGTSSQAAGGPTARLSGGGGAAASSGPPPDADAIVMRAADLLLVLAHADTATKVLWSYCSRCAIAGCNSVCCGVNMSTSMVDVKESSMAAYTALLKTIPSEICVTQLPCSSHISLRILHPVAQASLARRETLLQLIEVAHALPPAPALQLLRALRALTADPALLLPLYVRLASEPHTRPKPSQQVYSVLALSKFAWSLRAARFSSFVPRLHLDISGS